jgi:hypothetical protein
VCRLDRLGKDRRRSGAASRQPLRQVTIVELHADHERGGLDFRWCDSGAGDLRLPRRNGLKYRLDLASPDDAGLELEGDLDRLTRLAGIVL